MRRRTASFDDGRSHVGIVRVHGYPAFSWNDNQIHVRERQRAQEHLVAHHQGATEAHPVLEAHLHRTDVGHRASAAIGDSHALAILLLQPQGFGDALRQAKMNGTGVSQRFHLDGG